MQSKTTVTGFSAVSQGAAIAAAIGNSHTAAVGGSHIFILSVSEVEGGWTALALVVTEPELESLIEKRLQHEHEEKEYEKSHPKKDLENKLQEPYLHDIVRVHLPPDYEDFPDELIMHDFSDNYDQEIYIHRHGEHDIPEILDFDFHVAEFENELEPMYQVHVDSRTPTGLEQRPDRPLKKNILLEDLELDR